MGVGAGGDPLHPCPSSGPQDTLAVIQPSLVPGLGPDSPRVSTPRLVVPLGPGRLGTHGCRQVGTACRRQASLPACAGARPSRGSGASPAPKLACISFSPLLPGLPTSVHWLIPSPGPSQLWTQNSTHWGLSGHS